MMTIVTEGIVVHIAYIAICNGLSDAVGEQESQIKELPDGKERQQDVKMLLFPCFRRGGQKDERGKKEPDIAFERAPGNGHVFRVDESQQRYETDTEQEASVGDSVIDFEVFPLLAPVSLKKTKQHQKNADGPHEEGGEGKKRHHQHHQYVADVEIGV